MLFSVKETARVPLWLTKLAVDKKKSMAFVLFSHSTFFVYFWFPVCSIQMNQGSTKNYEKAILKLGSSSTDYEETMNKFDIFGCSIFEFFCYHPRTYFVG